MLSFVREGGQRWIRTTEGVSQQIYSLPHLATLVFARLLRELFSQLRRKGIIILLINEDCRGYY